MANRGERLRAALACALATALFLPLAWPIATGRVFAGDDLGRFHLPIRAFYADCLARGDDYRWHPGLYCGFYVHGEGQAGMDHPLHRLLYATLPLAAAFQIELILGYPLMFAGMGLWLRRVGLRSDGAWLGALVVSCSSFLMLRYVHMNAIQVIAHLPWILLGIEALARPRDDREANRAAAAIALLTASQGLLGYPQYLGFSLIVAGLYAVLKALPARFGVATNATGPPRAVLRACRDRSSSPTRGAQLPSDLPSFGPDWPDRSLRIKTLLSLGLSLSLGLLAASAQLLPHAEALALSARAKPTPAFLGMDSLHPMNLAQLVAPFAFRWGAYRGDGPVGWPIHESIAYLGAIVPASCAWLWIRRRDLGPWRPLAIGAAGVGIAALALALGRHSPLFGTYARLPVARLFRAPARYVLLAQMAGTVLSAIAFCDLAAMRSRARPLSRRALLPMLVPFAMSVLVGAALLSSAGLRPPVFRVEQIGSARDMAASALWLGAPCLLMAMAARGRRGALTGLILGAAIDSTVAGLVPILRHDRPIDPRESRLMPSSWAERSEPRQSRSGGARSTRPTHRGRTTAERTRRVIGPWNEAATRGERQVGGYVALTPARRLDYADPTSLRIAGLAEIQDARGERQAPALPPLPRARLVSRAIVSGNPRAELGAIDPATTALVDSPISLDAGPPGDVAITEDRPGRIRLESNASGRSLLILAESFHPGWAIRVNGRTAEPLRVYGDFLGCFVGPGRSEVAWEFRPASSEVGRWLSIVGLGFIGARAIARSRRAGMLNRERDIVRSPRRLTSSYSCDEMKLPLLEIAADREGST